MKIGMMTLWNAANGPSVHAELVGREWVKMGHRLVVFSAIRHPDARPTMQEDESYVIRHFAVDDVVPVTRASFFDPNPLLEEDYEVFVAQNVERLPTRELLDVFPEIRRKAVTVMVVHEGGPPIDPLYYRFEWDSIVCFDERYVEFISRFFPKDTIRIIPYPCHPLKLGDKVKARMKLNIPLDRRIVFSYGFRVGEYTAVLPALEELARELPLMYLVVLNPGGNVEEAKKAFSGYDFVELRVSALPLSLLYEYLHAADALLIHRESSRRYRAVLSSSVCLTIGSGCPILYHESNFVEKHGDEIIKYRDLEDLKTKLRRVFEGKFSLDRVRRFLEERSAEAVASRFIKLFRELLEGR